MILDDVTIVCPDNGCDVGGTPIEPINTETIVIIVLSAILIFLFIYFGIKHIIHNTKKFKDEESK